MKILGIDAGFSAPGAVIVEGSSLETSRILSVDCVVTEKKKGCKSVTLDDIRRVCETIAMFQRLITTHQPDLAIVELPLSGARSARAIKGMAYATACIISVLQTRGVPTIPINPYDNKKLSTGDSKAEKEDVISAVHAVWDDIPWPLKVLRGKLTTKPDEKKQEAIADALSTIIAYFKLENPDSLVLSPD